MLFAFSKDKAINISDAKGFRNQGNEKRLICSVDVRKNTFC